MGEFVEQPLGKGCRKDPGSGRIRSIENRPSLWCSIPTETRQTEELATDQAKKETQVLGVEPGWPRD